MSIPQHKCRDSRRCVIMEEKMSEEFEKEYVLLAKQHKELIVALALPAHVKSEDIDSL